MAADGIITQARADKIKARKVELAEDAGKLTAQASAVLRDVPDRADDPRTPTGRVRRARQDARRRAPPGALRGRPEDLHHARPEVASVRASGGEPALRRDPRTRRPGKPPPDTVDRLARYVGAARSGPCSRAGTTARTSSPRRRRPISPGPRSSPTSWRRRSSRASRRRRCTSSASPYFPPGGWPGSDCNCVMNAEGPGSHGIINLYQATTRLGERRVRAADPGRRAPRTS